MQESFELSDSDLSTVCDLLSLGSHIYLLPVDQMSVQM